MLLAKVELLTLKTFTEVVDEIYYKVNHLEPWERGTRKTAGMSKYCDVRLTMYGIVRSPIEVKKLTVSIPLLPVQKYISI